jgi:hypothetical protein
VEVVLLGSLEGFFHDQSYNNGCSLNSVGNLGIVMLYSPTGLILCLFVKPGYVKVGSFLTGFLPSKSLDLGSHI